MSGGLFGSDLQPQQLTLSVGGRDDSSLANFYSHGNELAVQAVEGIAEGIGEDYVFLWGELGSGRSHLLQAACFEASRWQRRAFYLPLDELAHYGPQLLDGLDQLDLICIDQIELIAGQQDWEEELFHLFNRLREAGKMLLIAASCAPRQLPIELADLASRLSWGVVFRLQALDDEGKQKALQLRARSRGIELSDEVALFILHRSPRTMSELFALLEQLDEASLIAQRKVTIPFVKQLLGW